MKKFILIMLATVLTVGYAQAQFKIGGRVGLTFTSVWGSAVPKAVLEKDSDVESLLGVQAGIVAEYNFSKNFAIQPAVLFATQGYATREKVDNRELLMNFNLNYIQMPVNLMFKAGSRNVKFILYTGPYVGYALNGKWKKEYSEDEKVTQTQKETIEFADDEIKRLDVGAGLGLGVQVKAMQIAVGYNLGLMNLSSSSEANFKNQSLGLTLSFLFGK